MKRGKAAGLDRISAEHLQYSHYILSVVLSKLFNVMILISYVPASFGQSYTVPLLKNSNSAYSKSITVNDLEAYLLAQSSLKFLSTAFSTVMLDTFVPATINLALKKNTGAVMRSID